MKLLNYFEKKSRRGKLDDDIIQLVSCPANGNACRQNLADINSLLSTAQQSRFSKEYGRSIYKMQEALNIADSIEGERCVKCARLFRSTILNSMDNVKDELEQLSNGFFQTRYKSSYNQVSVLLQELKASNL